MNEHEKLEEALDLLEFYVHRNGQARIGGEKVSAMNNTDNAALELLAACGRFRVTEYGAWGLVAGYWADEDPELKATP